MILMDFSYFFLLFSGFLGGVWGAVLGISAISATFSCSFQAFGLGLGCCFGNFCGFSYFFPGLFRLFGWGLGAVWGISAVSAVKSKFVCKFIFQLY